MLTAMSTTFCGQEWTASTDEGKGEAPDARTAAP